MSNTKERFNQKLLLEGNDDQHVVWALCERFRVDQTFDVIDCKGIEKLIKQIPLRIKQSNIQTIGIIVDADVDILKRWQQLKNVLQKEGILIPDNLPKNGLVFTQTNHVKIGIWIMPNNDLNGMLEDFIHFLIPNEDTLQPVVEAHLSSIETQQLNKYKLIHRSKAFIHAWLALQEDPGTPMGLSITKRYLTTDEKICLKFIDWLNRLFNPPTLN